MTYQLSDSELAKLKELKQYLVKRAKDIEAKHKQEEEKAKRKKEEEEAKRIERISYRQELKKMRLIPRARGTRSPYDKRAKIKLGRFNHFSGGTS